MQTSSANEALLRVANTIVPRVATEMVTQYAYLCLSHQDLVSIGNVAAVSALSSYDSSFGASFATYAYYRIKGAMLDAIRRETRDNKRAIALRGKIAACEYLAAVRPKGNVLTDTEADAQRHLQSFSDGLLASMAQGFASGQERPSAEEAQVAKEEYDRAIKALKAAASSLPPNDQRLLELRYAAEHELKAVARELGVSYATVRRQHADIMERLGKRLRSRGVHQAPPVEGRDP